MFKWSYLSLIIALAGIFLLDRPSIAADDQIQKILLEMESSQVLEKIIKEFKALLTDLFIIHYVNKKKRKKVEDETTTI